MLCERSSESPPFDWVMLSIDWVTVSIDWVMLSIDWVMLWQGAVHEQLLQLIGAAPLRCPAKHSSTPRPMDPACAQSATVAALVSDRVLALHSPQAGSEATAHISVPGSAHARCARGESAHLARTPATSADF